MYILLHGDNSQASRNELVGLKDKTDREIREVNGRNADLTQLIQALESTSLFGQDTLVIIERMLVSFGKKTSQVKAFAAVLEKNLSGSDIVLWEEKEISPGVLKLLGPKLDVKLFKTPVVIFRFLDSIHPGTGGQSLALLAQVFDKDAAELVYALLVKRIRHLIMIREGIMPQGMQSWQSARLTQQAKLFTMEKLRDMHKNLHRHETSLKRGSSPFTMKQILELILADV